MGLPARIALIAVGMGIAALESNGFKEEPGTLSLVGGVLMLIAFVAPRHYWYRNRTNIVSDVLAARGKAYSRAVSLTRGVRDAKSDPAAALQLAIDLVGAGASAVRRLDIHVDGYGP